MTITSTAVVYVVWFVIGWLLGDLAGKVIVALWGDRLFRWLDRTFGV